MADYARFILDALQAPGDAYQEGRRQNVNERQIDQWNQNYARQLGLDQYNQSADQRDFAYKTQRDIIADQQWQEEQRRLAAAAAAGEGSGRPKYGLSPIYGTDARGNPAIVQLGEDGQPIQPNLPEGFTPTPGVQKIDLGTEWGFVDRSGLVISRVPKEVAAEAAQTVVGKEAGAAQAALPGAERAADTVTGQIESLKNDPYLPNMVGPVDSWLPNISADSRRVQAKMDQVVGQTFMQGRELLKGGGPITDFESKRAEAAFARLNSAQNESDYRAALQEFQDAVRSGVEKLRLQAAQGQPARQPQSYGGQPMMQPPSGNVGAAPPSPSWRVAPQPAQAPTAAQEQPNVNESLSNARQAIIAIRDSDLPPAEKMRRLDEVEKRLRAIGIDPMQAAP